MPELDELEREPPPLEPDECELEEPLEWDEPDEDDEDEDEERDEPELLELLELEFEWPPPPWPAKAVELTRSPAATTMPESNEVEDGEANAALAGTEPTEDEREAALAGTEARPTEDEREATAGIGSDRSKALAGARNIRFTIPRCNSTGLRVGPRRRPDAASQH